jgi:hypothetical protein
MPFTADDKNHAHMRKMLPQQAFAEWCTAAADAEAGGLDHNECVRAGWAAVKASWDPPSTGRKWTKKAAPEGGEAEHPPVAVIAKLDDEQRVAWGWASVISVAGVPYVDTQGDIIDAETLEHATTDFMADVRLAKSMHEGGGIGEVLHSFPLTSQLAKSLGIQCDREGWIVGVKIRDDEVWARVKSGELAAFSIGGLTMREAA